MQFKNLSFMEHAFFMEYIEDNTCRLFNMQLDLMLNAVGFLKCLFHFLWGKMPRKLMVRYFCVFFFFFFELVLETFINESEHMIKHIQFAHTKRILLSPNSILTRHHCHSCEPVRSRVGCASDMLDPPRRDVRK